MKDGHGVHSRNIPGTYRPMENKDVDYLMDREAQRRGETFSGVRGIAQQDASLQESMGPIVDRTKERLVSSDTGIIKARQKLRKAVEALRDDGVDSAGRRSRAPPRPLGRDRATAGGVVHRLRARGRRRAPGRRPHVGVTRSARYSSRVAPGPRRRGGALPDRPAHRRPVARIVALDDGAADVVRRVAGRPWQGARFYPAKRRRRAARATCFSAAQAEPSRASPRSSPTPTSRSCSRPPGGAPKLPRRSPSLRAPRDHDRRPGPRRPADVAAPSSGAPAVRASPDGDRGRRRRLRGADGAQSLGLRSRMDETVTLPASGR